jgi:hypothetical protein
MVEAGNQAPTAEDDAFTATAGETAILWVLENDFDPDGDVLKIIFTSPPDHGSITNRDDGSLAYLPDRDFAGTEVLQYTIQDGSGGTDQASLTINVDSAQ